MTRTIFVTGGAGFIGSHLSEYLLKSGNRVIIFDNFNDYYDPAVKQNNIKEIQHMMQNSSIEKSCLDVIKGDIRDTDKLNEIFAGRKIDIIVHLAAMAGVRPSIKDPLLYSDVNINGTVNLLEICRKHNIDKFIFASSSSIYGNNKKVPFSESDNVDNPISPYAATKKAGELLCYTYHHLYSINIACLRFFTVYGPRQRPDLAIHKFTELIFNDEKIPFYGDGTTERDYTYIDDIIDGVVKAMDWIEKGKGRFDIFNLGESHTISLKLMLQTLETVINKKADINKLPMQPGDVDRTFANVTKAKEILGYNPKTDFKAGIEKFIEWYKKANIIT